MTLYIRDEKTSSNDKNNSTMWQDAESACTNQNCSSHQQQTGIKEDIGLIPVHSIFKKKSRNKPNQESERSLCSKL